MSIGFQQRKKRSRRDLIAQASLAQHLLKTLTAILIQHDGPLLVRRENMMLASGLRVNAEGLPDGNTRLTLQDTDGVPLPNMVTNEEAVPV